LIRIIDCTTLIDTLRTSYCENSKQKSLISIVILEIESKNLFFVFSNEVKASLFR
jgi:hypothetical protein